MVGAERIAGIIAHRDLGHELGSVDHDLEGDHLAIGLILGEGYRACLGLVDSRTREDAVSAHVGAWIGGYEERHEKKR